MNIITRAILINSRSGNEVSSIRKVHPRCLIYLIALWYSKNYNYKLNQRSVNNLCSQPRHYVEKISNVSRYEFTSIAVYKLAGLYSLSANLS